MRPSYTAAPCLLDPIRRPLDRGVTGAGGDVVEHHHAAHGDRQRDDDLAGLVAADVADAPDVGDYGLEQELHKPSPTDLVPLAIDDGLARVESDEVQGLRARLE